MKENDSTVQGKTKHTYTNIKTNHAT